MTGRQLVSSGSYLEPIIGFSRAVRVGNIVSVGGTAPIAAGGGTAAKGEWYRPGCPNIIRINELWRASRA